MSVSTITLPLLMTAPLSIALDRATRTPLSEQIREAVLSAIESGALSAGSRLPSWSDLAVQLGVSRGTVRTAYERLLDEQIIVTSKRAGTHVSPSPRRSRPEQPAPAPRTLFERYCAIPPPPIPFQVGVPALDCFPGKLFASLHSKAAKIDLLRPYPDLCGEPELRREIASYLRLARGIECSPAQVIVCGGYGSGLGLTLHALGLAGGIAWIEDPGFAVTKRSIQLAKLTPVPILVDGEGLNVSEGIMSAPGASLAIVTPGQQAPLGMPMSAERRRQLLDWAKDKGGWIIEDDYLGELQLNGRALPALAAQDRHGRVIHIGSFSKTVSPSLRLGFVVVSRELAPHFMEVARCLAPAPSASAQRATAEFLANGHYMRHLRRLKQAYSSRSAHLLEALERVGLSGSTAGLAVMIQLPPGTPDAEIASQALDIGLAPAPSTFWNTAGLNQRSCLFLGIPSTPPEIVADACARLRQIIDASSR